MLSSLTSFKDIKSPTSSRTLIYDLFYILRDKYQDIFPKWIVPLSSTVKVASEALVGFLGTTVNYLLMIKDVEEEVIRTEKLTREEDTIKKENVKFFFDKVQKITDNFEDLLDMIDFQIEFLGNDKAANLSNEEKNVRLLYNFWKFEPYKNNPQVIAKIKKDIQRYGFFVSLYTFFEDIKLIKTKIEEEEYQERVRKRKAASVSNNRRKLTETETLKFKTQIEAEPVTTVPSIALSSSVGPQRAMRKPTLARPVPTLITPPTPESGTPTPAARKATRKITAKPTDQPGIRQPQRNLRMGPPTLTLTVEETPAPNEPHRNIACKQPTWIAKFKK